jgi:hypothetical protein
LCAFSIAKPNSQGLTGLFAGWQHSYYCRSEAAKAV